MIGRTSRSASTGWPDQSAASHVDGTRLFEAQNGDREVLFSAACCRYEALPAEVDSILAIVVGEDCSCALMGKILLEFCRQI